MKVLHDSLLAMLRYEVLGQKALKEEAAKAKQVMETCFPAKLLNGLNSLLDDVPALDSTRSAQNMADQIISLFQQAQDDSENSNHTGSNDKTESPSSGQSGNQKSEFDPVSSQGTGDQTDSSQPEAQNTVNTLGEIDQEEKTDSTQGNDINSATTQGIGDASEENCAEAPENSLSDNIRTVLESDGYDWPYDTFEQLSEELTSWSAGQQGGLSAVTTTPSVDRVEVIDYDREEGQILLWKTKTESAWLAAQLSGLVQAKTLCRDRTGKRGKKLDGKRLYRMALGDNRSVL